MRLLAANLRRLGWIFRVLAAHALAHALGPRLARWPWLAKRLPPGDLTRPRRLAAVLEDLGGTFIKLGQMLALQPDILSLEYCNALFDLMDRVAPFPCEEAERVFREETGRSTEEEFDRFERTPVATASIGQVHVASKDGAKLAVKVQRPAVETEFAGDIRLMTAMLALIRRLRLKRFYWMIEPMSEFVGWTREELDYRNEARSMERLRTNAAGNPWEHVPAVGLATRRVLVAEFLEGVTVLDYLRAVEEGDEVGLRRLEATGFDATAVARRMIDNFLGDAFRYGLFHADLHPANLMIQPGSVVGYIDFGITGVLSRFSRHNLVALTLAYTRGDVAGMCAAFFRVSTFGPASDPEAFASGLRELAEGWYEAEGGNRRLRKNFTLVMLDMLTLSRRTGILPERDVIKYIRSAIALDGLITRFAPGFDLGAYLEEVCAGHLRTEARRELLSPGRIVDWMSAGGRLAGEGPQRTAALMSRLTAGELPWPVRLAGAPRRGGEDARRIVALGAVVFALSALLAWAPPGARPGINLFTAEMLLLAAALGRLLRSAARLA